MSSEAEVQTSIVPDNIDGRMKRFSHARLADALNGFYGRNPELDSGRGEREEKIRQHLEQTDPEAGIFGVSDKATGINVFTLLTTYFNPEFRRDVDTKNGRGSGELQTYFLATAAHHGTSTEAISAAVDYYYRHQEAFDAYVAYQRALRQRDPILPGNHPPRQLPLAGE